MIPTKVIKLGIISNNEFSIVVVQGNVNSVRKEFGTLCKVFK